jgi:hypothetical protein
VDPVVAIFILAAGVEFLIPVRKTKVPGFKFPDSTKTAFYINTTEELARRKANMELSNTTKPTRAEGEER